MEVLIKEANIVDCSQNFIGDVYIKDGLIDEIGKNLNRNCEVMHAKGLTLMPAFVDLHVHFRDPGLTYKEDIESGSKAAVKGGYTTVNLMANTKPVCSSMDTVNYVINKSREIGLIDVHQAVSITNNFDGKDISHLDKLDSEVKIISEDGKDVLDSKVMLEAMVKAKKLGKIVMCHSEEHSLTETDSRLSENIMTWRNITLAQFTGCPIHMAHVSTKEAMGYVIEAKKKGINVTCEIAPHHIALTDSDYKVNPPIRKREDVEFLKIAIKDGWVDAIATDHAPHSIEDKKNGSPGISGIETAFPICYTKLVKEGYITLNKLSEIMSRNPANIMGKRKGQVKIGYEADLILVDLQEIYKIDSSDFISKGKNTPFQSLKVSGKVKKTLKAGIIVF